jgi:hypothetical protein
MLSKSISSQTLIAIAVGAIYFETAHIRLKIKPVLELDL